MWVSKSRVEALEAKIQVLDDKLAALECVVSEDSSMYINTNHGVLYGIHDLIYPWSKKIPVKEAISKILSHFGLEFRHVSAKESVILEKAMIITANPYIPTTTPKKKRRKP